MTGARRLFAPLGLLMALAVVLITAAAVPSDQSVAAARHAATAHGTDVTPPIRHVFVINLENKGYDETWGPDSPAPYLSQTLRAKGVLLSQYYGTAHNSLPNYIGQISGQGPNPQNQGDCQIFSAFEGSGVVPPQQYVGDGCVFPRGVPTLPRQLSRAGLSWRGYMEDMRTPCRHPAVGAVDDTQHAEVGDQYAVRHNRSCTSPGSSTLRFAPSSSST
ncbi:MAG: hypothetical protein ACR2JU_01880 [Nocardioidaceae bacterium]